MIPSFQAIRSEGGLFSSELLARVLRTDTSLPGLSPADYHSGAGETLRDRISRSYARLLPIWRAFQAENGKLPAGDPATGLTRERWLLPLFEELGFGRLTLARNLEVPISHLWQQVPIHLLGTGVELDRRTPGVSGAAKQSPHSLVQEYVNRHSETLYGLVSNGRVLRLVRDNHSLTRQAYLEFDLEAMMAGELYREFSLLWLFLHSSRFESETLEKWHQESQQAGVRALGQLRAGVEAALQALGQGFLADQNLRHQLSSGSLAVSDYYRELLRLAYQLLFLFTAEDRGLLLLGGPTEQERYRYYSTQSLRELARKFRGSPHPDLWERQKVVLRALAQGEPGLALPALGGFLFADSACPHLMAAQLSNQDFLTALRELAFTRQDHYFYPVDFKNLGAEELGGVYESLLELTPQVQGAEFKLTGLQGNERKSSGSYYTPTGLVELVLAEALDPLIEAARKSPKPREALLALKVLDPASGSGHFLIAAGHRLARALAEIETGDPEPSPEATRAALRLVVQNCLYGVDLNPLALELVKVGFWLEAMQPGKPLSFLDHHLKLGNSLLGAPPDFYQAGIPKAAYAGRLSPENLGSLVFLSPKQQEKLRRESQQPSLFPTGLELPPPVPAEETLAEVEDFAAAYQAWRAGAAVRRWENVADYWTAAWFVSAASRLPDHNGFQNLYQAASQGQELPSNILPPDTQAAIAAAKTRQHFFHWWLEFPEVFSGAHPGFAAVIGNPPWEKPKLQEKEFFAARAPTIAEAANASARKRAIASLAEQNPALLSEYQTALTEAEQISAFLHGSGRYPLTGRGDVNLYSVFAELAFSLSASRAGMVVPTGIATDDSNKEFFAHLIQSGRLAALYDFENREGLFPVVHRSYRFSVLALRPPQPQPAQLAFFLTQPEQLEQPERRITLTEAEFELLNPNTRTTPVFRSRADAELTKKIYRQVPIFQNEVTGENPWGIRFFTMLHMSNDSGLFHTLAELPDFDRTSSGYLPLYEGKLIHQFDHRFATFDPGSANPRDFGDLEHQDPAALPSPRYWVAQEEVDKRLQRLGWQRGWLLGFRNIARATDERTAIFAFLPRAGVGHSLPLMLSSAATLEQLELLANMNSMILDFVARQKVGGTNLTYHYLRQFPVLPPSAYRPADLEFIAPRSLELSYTAWDLAPLAAEVYQDASPALRQILLARRREAGPDLGPPDWVSGEFPLAPFPWQPERRAQIRAELDAYYARLYGLSREELQYILEPQALKGPDFPSETFRVLRENEVKQYGEYRTARLVLEAWDRLEALQDAGFR